MREIVPRTIEKPQNRDETDTPKRSQPEETNPRRILGGSAINTAREQLNVLKRIRPSPEAEVITGNPETLV